jgi:hypothetical protein
MTPVSALAELIDRVGARDGKAVFISASELDQWPAAAVAGMKAQKLLLRARPSASVICPGCERECSMPVETVTNRVDRSASFVVCDKRSDINRVPIPENRLIQWRCDAKALSDFTSMALRLTRATEAHESAGLWRVGIASGETRRQMLCLRAIGRVELVAGDASIPFSDVVEFRQGEFCIDSSEVCRLVDSSASADERYTPSVVRREARKQATQDRYKRWQRAYRQILKISPGRSDVWYSEQIAKKDSSGRNAATIRKHMKP